MLELKTEVKVELRLLFHDMLNEIKGDSQQQIKQNQPQQPIQPMRRKLINPFHS